MYRGVQAEFRRFAVNNQYEENNMYDTNIPFPVAKDWHSRPYLHKISVGIFHSITALAESPWTQSKQTSGIECARREPFDAAKARTIFLGQQLHFRFDVLARLLLQLIAKFHGGEDVRDLQEIL